MLASYETTVTHKGDLWGLMPKDLKIKKDVCEIVVEDKGILESSWKIDVCREPIHIKATEKGSLSVYKRSKKCENSDGEFCESWKNLKSALEDKGLIFAQGEREKLDTSHGKIYCVYLLLQKHLDEGILFSKYQDPVDIYKNGLKAPKIVSPAPKKEASNNEKVEAEGRF